MDAFKPCHKVLSWNVHGLNNVAKQEEVRQVINLMQPDLTCLQETKLEVLTPAIIRNTLVADYEHNFLFQPALGTGGGILLASKESRFNLQAVECTDYAITTEVYDCATNASWAITGVYGPQDDFEKKMFLRHLRRIKQLAKPQWLLIGDFNVIYQAQDKNNNRLNRRLIMRVRRTLNSLEVKEVDLVGKQYTSSNNQDSPTLTRIDRAFFSIAWECMYNNPILHALSSSASNHCPILLGPLNPPSVKPRFRFESHWVQMPSFLECIESAWHKEVAANQIPLAMLHIKLTRTAKALRAWAKTLIPQGKIALVIYREVILQLEKA
jgi:exonuclease III